MFAKENLCRYYFKGVTFSLKKDIPLPGSFYSFFFSLLFRVQLFRGIIHLEQLNDLIELSYHFIVNVALSPGDNFRKLFIFTALLNVLENTKASLLSTQPYLDSIKPYLDSIQPYFDCIRRSIPRNSEYKAK